MIFILSLFLQFTFGAFSNVRQESDPKSLPGCPLEYYPYKDRCFKFYPTQKMWIQASEECSNEDGKLASIPDLGYDMFLFSKMFGKGGKSPLFS